MQGQAEAEKGITWHINVRGPVCSLIVNGKLTNQIARLVAIVVKFGMEKELAGFELLETSPELSQRAISPLNTIEDTEVEENDVIFCSELVFQVANFVQLARF